jgi:hypothetical protein
VAEVWFIWSVESVSFGWLDEQERPTDPQTGETTLGSSFRKRRLFFLQHPTSLRLLSITVPPPANHGLLPLRVVLNDGFRYSPATPLHENAG